MMILEVNHADYECGATDALSEAISQYVDLDISTDEFWGVLQDYVPTEGLDPWEGADAYGLKPNATFAFDGGVEARLFETGHGFFVEFFKS